MRSGYVYRCVISKKKILCLQAQSGDGGDDGVLVAAAGDGERGDKVIVI